MTLNQQVPFINKFIENETLCEYLYDEYVCTHDTMKWMMSNLTINSMHTHSPDTYKIMLKIVHHDSTCRYVFMICSTSIWKIQIILGLNNGWLVYWNLKASICQDNFNCVTQLVGQLMVQECLSLIIKCIHVCTYIVSNSSRRRQPFQRIIMHNCPPLSETTCFVFTWSFCATRRRHWE